MRLILFAQVLLAIGIACAEDEVGDPVAKRDREKKVVDAPVYRIEMKVIEVRNDAADSKTTPVETKVDWKSRRAKGEQILLAPSVMVRANQTASLSSNPSKPIKYLEPDGDSHFSLKELEADKLGLHVEVQTDGDSIKVEIDSVTLDGGEKGKQTIVGVDVPIGKPILRQKSTEVMVKLADLPAKIAIPTASGKHAFVLMRVSKE